MAAGIMTIDYRNKKISEARHIAVPTFSIDSISGIFSLLLLCCWQSAAYAATAMVPDYHILIEHMRKSIPGLMYQHNTPGLALVLVDDDRIVWQQGFGKTKQKKGEAVTASTLFRYGSASSLFVADAVMNEAGAGRLQLHRPVTHYLPKIKISNRFGTQSPTVHDVLSHHGGMPVDYLKGKWGLSDESLTSLPSSLELMTAPRHVYVQSKIGIELLARVVEHSSNTPYRDYVNKCVLEPIGIKRDVFDINGPQNMLARGHLDKKIKPVLVVRDKAAAGAYISANELGQYLKYVLASGHNNWRFQEKNRDVSLDLGSGFAYGWALSAFDIYNAGTIAHFSGESLHYQSQTVVAPEHGLAVAVLANAYESRELVDSVARDVLSRALNSKKGIRQRLPERAVPLNKTTKEGYYATWRGLARVYRKGKYLRLEMNNRPLFLIEGPELFKMQYRLLGMVPINVEALNKIRLAFRASSDANYMLARFKGWDFVFGQRLEQTELPDLWKGRLGKYKVINNDSVLKVADIELELIDGILCVGYQAPPYIPERVNFPLKIISDDKAVFAGIGRNLGEQIIFSRKGEKNQLMLSGFVARQQ
jgi:CubicO group peptidase (beta-lactamase class C family)